MEKLEGTVTEIIFSNENNGYCVCSVANGDEEYTVVGTLPFVEPGNRLSMTGEWVNHLEFGEQFKVATFSHILPESCNDIFLYLASGAIKGVKEATARRIVDTFGENSLNIIQNQPEKLCSVKGITPDKANAIHNKYISQINMQGLVSFFTEHGIPTGFAYKVYTKLGENSISLIKKNPYVLCEVDGIGFRTADKIAASMNFSADSPERIDAAIIFCLSENVTNGHTYLPSKLLCSQTARLLYMPEDIVAARLINLIINTRLRRRSGDGDDFIYLPAFFVAEEGSANFLKNFTKEKPKKIPKNIPEKLKKAEKDSFPLAELQKTAVTYALENSCTVITGGPGTGKTTIIKTIISLLTEEGCNVSLCAPTGRAAKRMTQLCGVEAKTVHRLLEAEYSYDKSKLIFKKNSENPLDTDAVIVDEMSMVDILLFYNLIKAVPAGCRLILVGDSDQLPSVGAGNVLRDIITSEIVKTVRLREIFRQSEESLIVTNAHRINSGEYPICKGGSGSDFFYINRSDTTSGAAEIVSLCLDRLPKYLGKPSLDAVQVITPTRKGPVGAEALNFALQAAYNPPSPDKPELKRGRYILRRGDKIMQTRNNYDIQWYGEKSGVGIFNGDMGIILDIDTKQGILKILFDGEKETDYPIDIAEDLELAYAITVHKSQGSEFDAVVLPMYRVHPNLMSRNLFYTAVTRAKSLVVLVGREDIITYMTDNNYQAHRYSGLADILTLTEGETQL